MKILQVISSFPPAYSYGGALNVAYNISKGLASNKQDITVYTTDVYNTSSRYNPEENPKIINGFKVHYFKNISNYLAAHNIPIALKILVELNKNIKNYDIIHIHEYRSFQTMVTYYFAKKYNVPYIIQPHGSLPRILNRQKLKALYDSLLGNKILKDATKVIALNKNEAFQLLHMGVSINNIEIIYNAIEKPRMDYSSLRGVFRQKYSIGPDEKIILSLCRIHKIKGLDFLAKAFASLIKEKNNARLVIIGPDDGFLSTLNSLVDELDINKKVLILGPIYGDEKFEAYIDADVYVLPSSYDMFPMTILESCSCGTPVVVTTQCGIADIIDNVVGCAVEYNNVDQLRQTIYNILYEDDLRIEFKRNCSKLMESEFGLPQMVERLELLYIANSKNKK